MNLLNNLVSYWAFNGTCLDSFGSNHGTIYNASYSVGKVELCLDLNIAGAYAKFSSPSSLYLSQPFTYTFWANAPENDLDSTYFYFNGDSGIQIKRTATDGKVVVVVGENSKYITSTQRIDTDSWNFVSVVVSGSNSKIYINTVDVTDICTVSSGIEYSSSDMYIGYNSIDEVYTNMLIDEVGIWNKVLTSEDITLLYNNNFPPTMAQVNSPYFSGGNFANITSFFNLNNSLHTVEAWVNPTKNSSAKTLFGRGGVGETVATNIMSYVILGPNVVRCTLETELGVDREYLITTTIDILDGRWHHIAFVVNSTNLKVYIDGVLSGETTIVNSDSTATTYCIGNNNPSGASVYQGYMSNLRVWNAARSQEQIVSNMYDDLLGTEEGLIANFRLDGGIGDIFTSTTSSGTYTATMVAPCNWVMTSWARYKLLYSTAPTTIVYNTKGAVGVSKLKFRTHLLLEDTTSYVSCGNNSVFNLTNNFTISTWVFTYGSTLSQTILAKENAYMLGINSNDNRNKIHWALYITAATWVWVNTNVSLPLNEWHYITFQYNGLQGIVYLDAVEISRQFVSVSGNVATNTNIVYIGKRQANTEIFYGAIGELSFWNKLLAANEIQYYMGAGINGSESNLIVGYNFSNGSSTTLVDCVGAVNGTINYGAWGFCVNTVENEYISLSSGAIYTLVSGSLLNLKLLPNQYCTTSGVVINNIPIEIPTTYPYTEHSINAAQENNIEIIFRDLNQYTVVAQALSSGTITPQGALSYYEFETPEFVLTPTNSNYRLKNIHVNEIGVGNNYKDYSFDRLTSNSTITAEFDLLENIDGVVLTVQNIELNLSSHTIVSGSLTKGQNYLNCVPFVTQNRNGLSLNQTMVDVSFSEGWVFAETVALTSEIADISISIVEFNPAKVQVVSSTFSMTTTTTNVTIDNVDLTKTFLMFYYKSSSTTSYLSIHNVRGQLSTETNIEFYRYTTGGTIFGHYYLVKALNSEFSVQHVTTTIGVDNSKFYYLSEYIDIYRSFLISSYTTDFASLGYLGRTTARASIVGGRSIQFYKTTALNTVYFNTQVISIAERGKVFVNFCRYYAMTSLDRIGAVPTGIFNNDKYTISNSSSNCGLFGLEYGDAGQYLTSGLVCVTPIDRYSFRLSRCATNAGVGITLQFVNWDGYNNSKIITTPINSTIVKSVEHFSDYMSIEKIENVKYLFLSKGQNVNQCVPFYTAIANTSASYQRGFKCDIDISSGGIVTLVSAYGHDCSFFFDLTIVEFYEEEAKIEKGFFYIADTSVTVPVSGTTSSGVSNINKSVLQFTYTLDYGGTWGSSTISGLFVGNSLVGFYRGVSDAPHGAHGHYYVIEFLTSSVDTTHFQTNVWGTDSNVDVYPVNTTLPVVTYSSDLNSAGYPGRVSCFYCHQAPQVGYLYRVSSTLNSIYPNISIIRFNSGVKVQRYRCYMGATTISGSIALNFAVSYNSSMVINSNQLGLGAITGDANTISYAAYLLVELTEDGTTLKYSRYASGGQEITAYFYVIDFAAHYYMGPYKNSNGFINSIEHFNFGLTSDGFKELVLTKKQNIDSCVPFITARFTSENTLCNLKFMVDLLKQSANFYRADDICTGTSFVRGSIVEFNPRYVKVTKYYFHMNGVDSCIVILNTEVDVSKTFIIVYYSGSSGAYASITIRAHLLDGTSIEVKRGATTSIVFGVLYVVESLGDSFTVEHIIASTAGNVYVPIATLVDKNTVLLSSYFSDNAGTGYSDRSTINSYLAVLNALVAEKYSPQNNIYSASQIIRFKSSILVKGAFSLSRFPMSSSQYQLSTNFNCDNIVIIPTLLNNSAAINNNTATPINVPGFFTAELVSSGTGLSIERALATHEASIAFSVIEFVPPKQYYFEGVVREENTVVDRVVALYRRSTNELIDTTTSSGTYGYRLESPYSDEHYIVCLDDDGGADFNALIIDRALGTEIFPLG